MESTATQTHRLNPEARIIIMLRNPIDRLYSEYLYFRLNGDKPSPDDFHRRVVGSIRTLGTCNDNATMTACAHAPLDIPLPLHVGMYHVFMRDWVRTFGRRRVLVIRLEDYSQRRADTLRGVFQFLDVGDFPSVVGGSDHVVNEGSIVAAPMRNDTRQLLRRFYKTHNRQLAQMLGDQRFLWKK